MANLVNFNGVSFRSNLSAYDAIQKEKNTFFSDVVNVATKRFTEGCNEEKSEYDEKLIALCRIEYNGTISNAVTIWNEKYPKHSVSKDHFKILLLSENESAYPLSKSYA